MKTLVVACVILLGTLTILLTWWECRPRAQQPIPPRPLFHFIYAGGGEVGQRDDAWILRSPRLDEKGSLLFCDTHLNMVALLLDSIIEDGTGQFEVVASSPSELVVRLPRGAPVRTVRLQAAANTIVIVDANGAVVLRELKAGEAAQLQDASPGKFVPSYLALLEERGILARPSTTQAAGGVGDSP